MSAEGLLRSSGGGAPPNVFNSGKIYGACVAALLLLAGLLRFAGLEHLPRGLFRDEAEKGYNAWALANTGSALEIDPTRPGGAALRAARWPWMINVLGNETSALYHYAAAPWVGAGGLTVANTRRAASLFGWLAVAAGMWLGTVAWGRGAGLACGLSMALAPWLVTFSRWAQQGSAVPLLVVLALVGCLGLEQRRRWGWPLLGGALGWLFYAYAGAQPFVLAWGSGLLMIYGRKIEWRREGWQLAGGLALFALPVVPTLLVVLGGPAGTMRLGQVAVWSGETDAVRIVMRLLLNYALHFDPRFLWLSGDPQPRHGYGAGGMLTGSDLILLPVGLVALWRGRGALRLPICWLLLCGPVGAVITRENPHALRSLPMAAGLTLAAGYGLANALAWIGQRGAALGGGPRARLYQAVLVGMTLLSGAMAFRMYLRAADGVEMRLAFQATMRGGWERIAAERREGQTIYMNGAFPYAPYWALFFQPRRPGAIVSRGFEQALGVTIHAPNQQPWGLPLKPGDWWVEPNPTGGEGSLLLDAGRLRTIGEIDAQVGHFAQ